jgi:hypothetical protein
VRTGQNLSLRWMGCGEKLEKHTCSPWNLITFRPALVKETLGPGDAGLRAPGFGPLLLVDPCALDEAGGTYVALKLVPRFILVFLCVLPCLIALNCLPCLPRIQFTKWGTCTQLCRLVECDVTKEKCFLVFSFRSRCCYAVGQHTRASRNRRRRTAV